MKYRTLLFTTTLITFLFSACEKKEAEHVMCTDPGAMNYNKPIACAYLKDHLIKKMGFSVTLVSYPLDPVQEGDSYSMDVRNAGSDHYTIKMYWKNAILSPGEFNVILAKDSFTISPAKIYVSWAGAPISGTGRFRNDSFFFNGTVHSASGGDAPIVLEGF